MSIKIRAADLDKDRESLITMLFQYLTRLSDGDRFDWLYLNNPHGKAHAWVAADTENCAIIGSAAAIPHRLYVDGIEKTGYLLADFWIHPQYRSLGPAVQLQRACVDFVESGSTDFFYDLPQSSMGSVYQRLGIVPREMLLRLAKPLRLDKKIRTKINIPIVASCLSGLSNRLLELRDFRLGGKSECTISIHQDAFGAEFSELARNLSAAYGACVVRSAEYLNWRYRSHYHIRYEILTARRNETLVAYVIFADMGDYGQIVDLYGINQADVLRDLVAGVLSILRERGTPTVNAPLLASHPWVGIFENLGFRVRESHPIIVYDSSARRTSEAEDRRGWHLMYGDLDH
jgi:GNAT superfamily N-acetyltransferase